MKIQAFSTLAAAHEDIWSRFAAKTCPYVPVVTTGWDKRPWEDPSKPEEQSVYYPDRTPPQVGSLVERAVKWLDAHPEKTVKELLILLYAWNENGEGGYLTPTRCHGDTYLKAIANVLRRP
ncbi:MAG: glycoside hydrolase family 99-like domain-containing protein [Candidatus Bathyarchaeia archaeon]